MTGALSRSWSLFAARGALALALGVGAFLWPSMRLSTLVLLFGIYALLDGITAVAIGTRQRAREHAGLHVLEGLAGIGLGLAVLFWARFAAELLVLAIALWAVATGIVEVVMARRLRGVLPSEGLLGVAGAASIALGIAIFVWPTSSSLALVLLVGSYGVTFGGFLLAQAFRLRKVHRRIHDHGEHFGPRPRAA
jgi:uncharacterized membrane protein HdeD (DUF308 family)